MSKRAVSASLWILGIFSAAGLLLFIDWHNQRQAISSAPATAVTSAIFFEGPGGAVLLADEEVSYWRIGGNRAIVLPEKRTVARVDVVDLATGVSVARRKTGETRYAGRSPRYLWMRVSGELQAWDPYTGQVAATSATLANADPALKGGWHSTEIDRDGNLWLVSNDASVFRINGSTLAATAASRESASEAEPWSACGGSHALASMEGRERGVKASDGERYSFAGSPKRRLRRGDELVTQAGAFIAPALVCDLARHQLLELPDPPSLLIEHRDSLAGGAGVQLTRVSLKGDPLWSHPVNPSQGPHGDLLGARVYRDTIIAVFPSAIIAIDAKTGAVRWQA